MIETQSTRRTSSGYGFGCLFTVTIPFFIILLNCQTYYNTYDKESALSWKLICLQYLATVPNESLCISFYSLILSRRIHKLLRKHLHILTPKVLTLEYELLWIIILLGSSHWGHNNLKQVVWGDRWWWWLRPWSSQGTTSNPDEDHFLGPHPAYLPN